MRLDNFVSQAKEKASEGLEGYEVESGRRWKSS